jgi:glycine/D-amino acid oxidase-like deaminating enzyme
MAIGWMWDYQVVELSGLPEPDEATLNSFGLIGYELVAVTPAAATGRLLASLTRGTPPEEAAAEPA